MSLSTPLLQEFQHEAAKTKRYLEIVPSDKHDWKPHEKSMSLVQLAGHVAELPGWLHYTIDAPELDFATMNYQPPVITDNASLMKLYEDNVILGGNSLSKATDENLQGLWRLRNAHHVILEMPRTAVIRDMVFNHMVHHRGQLSVYLRLLNIKLPGLYGPSADEMEMY